MQQLIDQVAGLAEGPEHLEKVVITRPFLKAVWALLLKLQAELKAARADRRVCESCGECVPFEIPERDDGKHAPRMAATYIAAEADFQRCRSVL